MSDSKVLTWFDHYLRYCDYLAAAQLYLKDNVFLRRPLAMSDIKERILGHWGTVPGLSFIYAHCSYLISKHNADMIFIAGPGHGAPAIQATLFAENSISELYPEYPRNEKGTSAFAKAFSWPGGFPSHLTPMSPGSILEGGELGYSLATAYGAVLDNPTLIAACVVGDGEAETGPLAAAWHSNKFLNPAESGAVLPILHDNGYKISGPTIYSAMSNKSLTKMFEGMGYIVRIVEQGSMHEKMIDAMEWAYGKIRAIQMKARGYTKTASSSHTKFSRQKSASHFFPEWPMIILRSPKGWHGVKEYKGKRVEGNFRSHGIPLGDVTRTKHSFDLLKKWLESYKIHELVDAQGRPRKEILAYLPKGNKRMGRNLYAYGGDIRRILTMPKTRDYAITIESPGTSLERNTEVGAQFMRDIFVLNKKKNNFRFFCPDETDSNKMSPLFEVTGRPFMLPVKSYDERMDPRGRVMEILSEHTLQGWLQGYILTGRHGIFATYEAFAQIVASMVDQHAKFLKQSMKLPWRKPIASLNYILTSVGWRQEHNGYSHQNPGFISSVLEKHGDFCSVYFPPDANMTLVTLEDCLSRTNAINVIVVDKQEMPQWLNLSEAYEQHEKGIGIWRCIHSGWQNPDVVIASIGDHLTIEAVAAARLLEKIAPAIKVRFVNISELTALGVGDEKKSKKMDLAEYFTSTVPVIINFHGYVGDMYKLLWNKVAPDRVSVHGYSEEGTTTTPFDMHVRNQTSRYHIAMDAAIRAAQLNKKLVQSSQKIINYCQQKLMQHQKYIRENGKDMPL